MHHRRGSLIHVAWRRPVAAVGGFLFLLAAAGAPGCDAFNPAFVDTFAAITPLAPDPIGPNSRGHVVVAFRNDTFFDEQLLQQLVANGLDEELLNDPDARPRVRVRLRITFSNGEQLDTEFNDGSATIIDPRVDASTFPELTRTEQTNLVVQCDVSRVELIVLPSIFVPVFFESIRIDPGDENTAPFRVLLDTTNPRFELLQIDDVDAQGTTILQRNLDIRDVPGPAIGPNCGSVVTITLSGTLRTPFVVNAQGVEVPGALITEANAIASNPGRFRLAVGIQ